VPERLDIYDFVQQNLEIYAVRVNEQRFFRFIDFFHGSVEGFKQLVFADGFYKIMQGGYFVSVGDKIGQCSNKNDDKFPVRSAQISREFYAVLSAHLYVEQQYVIFFAFGPSRLEIF